MKVMNASGCLPSAISNIVVDLSKNEIPGENEEKILTSDDFENTPKFDPYVWWSTSAKYDELKEGDMIKIVNEVEFQVTFNGKNYHLQDKQGAYLGDIDKDEFNSILDCTKRMEDTYFRDYFGAKFDCNCFCCGKALVEDDYCFENHDGKPLCDACAILCEGCDKYYTEDEGEFIDEFFTCNNCKKNINIPEITLESQILHFAKEVLEHFRSGDVFGGIKEYRDGKLFSTCYVGAYKLFEINKEYKEKKVNGITVSYKRDDKNNVIEFELTNVFYDGKVLFQLKNTLCKIPMPEMKKMIVEADNSVENLQNLLLEFVKVRPAKTISKTLFDFAAQRVVLMKELIKKIDTCLAKDEYLIKEERKKVFITASKEMHLLIRSFIGNKKIIAKGDGFFGDCNRDVFGCYRKTFSYEVDFSHILQKNIIPKSI